MDNTSFEYTYSAHQQQEVEAIRKKYLPREEDKMERLRRLHSIPTRKARTQAIFLSVIGALVLGTGMSLCMTELGSLLGEFSMLAGICIGLVGMLLIALAYPVYSHTLAKERSRIAPEVLQLANELLQ